MKMTSTESNNNNTDDDDDDVDVEDNTWLVHALLSDLHKLIALYIILRHFQL